MLLHGGGMRIVLNEQVIEGDGRSSLKITVNAIHVSFDDVLVTRLGGVRGDIILGQSTARLACEGADEVPITCAGDCDQDAIVTVDELVTVIAIALGEKTGDTCASVDTDLNGIVTVDEILTALGHIMEGCG